MKLKNEHFNFSQFLGSLQHYSFHPQIRINKSWIAFEIVYLHMCRNKLFKKIYWKNESN